MKKLPKKGEQKNAVARAKAEISPATPCIHADAESIEPEVLPPLGKIENPDYTKPGERISYHISMGQYHGRVAFAHLILAGWELAVQKQAIGYGGWAAWCAGNLQISSKTADRYALLYQKTVGAARSKAAIPLAKRVTNKELEAATVGMEGKSATRVMVDLEIIKRKDWGGDRSDKAAKNGHKVGRPTKDAKAEAAEEAASSAAVRAELSAEEGRDLIAKLAGWALGADDGFGTLPDGELARAVKTLRQVLERAEEIKSAREGAR